MVISRDPTTTPRRPSRPPTQNPRDRRPCTEDRLLYMRVLLLLLAFLLFLLSLTMTQPDRQRRQDREEKDPQHSRAAYNHFTAGKQYDCIRHLQSPPISASRTYTPCTRADAHARAHKHTHTHTNLPTLPIYKRDPTQQQTVTSPFSHYAALRTLSISLACTSYLPLTPPSFHLGCPPPSASTAGDDRTPYQKEQRARKDTDALFAAAKSATCCN